MCIDALTYYVLEGPLSEINNGTWCFDLFIIIIIIIIITYLFIFIFFNCGWAIKTFKWQHHDFGQGELIAFVYTMLECQLVSISGSRAIIYF